MFHILGEKDKDNAHMKSFIRKLKEQNRLLF